MTSSQAKDTNTHESSMQYSKDCWIERTINLTVNTYSELKSQNRKKN